MEPPPIEGPCVAKHERPWVARALDFGVLASVVLELDDLPAVKAFVAAGIGVMPMHGLIIATLPAGATARPLADRPAGSRTVEALAPAEALTPPVNDLLELLTEGARAYDRLAGGS